MKRKEKTNYGMIFFAVFIILSMVFSIFIIILDNPSQGTLVYNKKDFSVTETGTYKVKIDGKFMEFNYYPSELERIPLSPETLSTIKKAQNVIVIFDPNMTTEDLMFSDLARFELQTQLPVSLGFAMTKDSALYALPVVQCEQATAEYPIIFINSSSTTGFITTENPYCIVMNGRLREIVASKDRLVYTYLGVMTP